MGDLLAHDAVVAGTALAQVVQEGGDVELAPGMQLGQDLGRERQLARELAPLHLPDDAHGPDGVLVDRVDVVEIVLHLADHAAEIGDEAAQQPALVHPPQGQRRVLARAEDVEEEPVGLGILA